MRETMGVGAMLLTGYLKNAFMEGTWTAISSVLPICTGDVETIHISIQAHAYFGRRPRNDSVDEIPCAKRSNRSLRITSTYQMKAASYKRVSC